MTDAAPQTPETEEDKRRAADIARFEKFFRLLDSDQDGEAESALRQARKVLPKLGLTFGQILEMVGQGGGTTEELTALVGEYKAANDELKAAETVMLQENARRRWRKIPAQAPAA